MKVYQCIHKYSPHIPFLERKHNIGQRSLSFEELRNIIIQDGYAAPYILKPAIEGKADQVFTPSGIMSACNTNGQKSMG